MKLSDFKYGDWLITANGVYYQFINRHTRRMYVSRFGVITNMPIGEFVTTFRLANEGDIRQHLNYLNDANKSFISIFNENSADVVSVFPLNHGDLKSSELKSTTLSDDFIDVYKCNFYMTTVDGSKGSKVRHFSYKLAEKEAIRLCKLTNETVAILGVVAKVKPIVEISHEVIIGNQ